MKYNIFYKVQAMLFTPNALCEASFPMKVMIPSFVIGV